jgi:hypothetical protein
MDKKPQTVTMDHLESLVVEEEYLRPESAPTLTICVLKVANGFSVRGESACADPAAYDEAKGREFARRDAIQKLWPLEGYLLRQRLHDGGAIKSAAITLRCPEGFNALFDALGFEDTTENRGRLDDALKAIQK